MTHADIAAELSCVSGEIRSRMLSAFPDANDFGVIVNFKAAAGNGWSNRVEVMATVYHERMSLADRHADGFAYATGTLDDIADKAVVAAHDKMHAATLRARQISEGVTA